MPGNAGAASRSLPILPRRAALITHPYLEHGLTILHTRLGQPNPSRPAEVPHGVRPFITLSRETGAGTTTTGHFLVPLLAHEPGDEGSPWVLLEKDLLTHALTHHRRPERLAAFLPEYSISETKAVIGELVGLHPSLWALEHQIAEAVLQLAHVGHVIFAGRAANLITRGVPGALPVRLAAQPEVRAGLVARLLIRTAAALTHPERNDFARRRWVYTHFEQDIDHPCPTIWSSTRPVFPPRPPPASSSRRCRAGSGPECGRARARAGRGRTASQGFPAHDFFFFAPGAGFGSRLAAMSAALTLDTTPPAGTSTLANQTIALSTSLR